MNGQAIAAQAIAYARLRELATEQTGPRPAGTGAETTAPQPGEGRFARATRP